MGSPVTMFGPDGQLHDVPADKVGDAMDAGGETAVLFDAPDGKQHWVRQSQQEAATQAGGKIHQDSLFRQAINAADQFLAPRPEGKVAAYARGGVSGLLTPLLHPQETLAAMGQPFAATGMAPGGMYPTTMSTSPQGQVANAAVQQQAQQGQKQAAEGIRENPAYSLGQLTVPALVTHALTKAPIGSVLKRGAEVITGTAPSSVKPLVEEVGKNRAAAANAVTEQQHKLDLYANDIRNKAAEIEQADAAKAGELSRKHAEAVKKAQDANQKALLQAQAETDADQRAYFEKRAAHQQKTAQIELNNKAAMDQHQLNLKQHEELQGGLNEADKSAKAELKAVENRVHTDANQMYEDLKPKLAKVEADPEATAEMIDNLRDNYVQPATGEPPLLTKFAKLFENHVNPDIDPDTGKPISGRPVTYADYDNFRSALGRELRKGTLNPDHYHLYNVWLNGEEDPITGERSGGIVDEMQRMADTQGLSEEADAARSAWRNWAQAFRDRKSPLRKILQNPEEFGALKTMRGQQSYLERLRNFGDDGAALADRIEQGITTAQQSGATYPTYGGIKVPKPKAPPIETPGEFTTPAPQVKMPLLQQPPKAPPLQLTSGSPIERAFQTTTQPSGVEYPAGPQNITPDLLQKAKAQALENTVKLVKRRGEWVASGVGAYKLMRDVFAGRVDEIPKDIGETGIAIGGVVGLSKLLENPAIVEKLTRPTARDVLMIPEDMRRDLGPIVQQAQRQGIKVSPALVTAVSLASANRWYNQNQ